MLKKTRGLIIKNLYIHKKYIVTSIVIIIILFKYLSEDFLKEGIDELQLSANIYGFVFIYILSIFTSNFVEIKVGEKWNKYLLIIQNGMKCEVLAKYITDFLFLVANTILVSGVISSVLFYYKAEISIKFYFGIILSVIIVLINNGIDNMISFIYNKIIYKIILFLIMIMTVIIIAYLIINKNLSKITNNFFNYRFVLLYILTLFSVLIYILLCKLTMKKIELHYKKLIDR